MAGPIAVLDADILVPILSCDLLLTAFDHDLYQPIVTPRILDEVERNLLRAFPHLDPVALRRRVDQMRRTLALHTRDDADEDDVWAADRRPSPTVGRGCQRTPPE